METNCLLELPMGEGSGILGEVNLKTSIQSTGSTETDVGSILLDSNGESHGGSSFSTSGIDFEFVNSELGSASAYTMDHSSVFDISEPVIDEKSELFRDSGVFDDCMVKHNEIEKSHNMNLDLQNGRKLIMDLGLKLQIIPLNNLKFVSTIQTSEGVHIVALPDNSSISQRSIQDQPMIRDIFSQLNTHEGMARESGKVVECHSKDIININTSIQRKTDVLRVVQLQNSGAVSTIGLIPNNADLKLAKQSSKRNTMHVMSNLHLNPDTTSAKSLLNIRNDTMHKNNMAVANSKQNGQVDRQAFAQEMKRQKKHLKTFQESGANMLKGKLTEKPVLKESKIIIDLRKLMPHRKPRRMVSLLSSPKTKKLLACNRLLMDTKMKAIQHRVEKLKTLKSASHQTLSKKKPDNDKQHQKLDLEQELDENCNGSIKEKEKTLPKFKKSNKSVKRRDQGYRCAVCQAKFIRLGNYKNHILLHKEFREDHMIEENIDNVYQTESLEDTITDIKEHLNSNFPVNPSDNANATEQERNTQTVPKLTNVSNIKKKMPDDKTYDKIETEGQEHDGPNSALDELNQEDEQISIDEINLNEPNCVNSFENVTNEPSLENITRNSKDYTPVANSGIKEKCDFQSTTQKKEDLQCYVCQLTFSSEGNLTRHKLTHMKPGGRYMCVVCKKCFHQQCDLKRHETVHTGQFPYSCNTCSKGFLRKTDLTGHVKFHIKQKTHQCELCSKSYYQSGDLQRHIRQSHQDTCQFSCLYCSKKYTAQRSLFTHVRSKHMQHSIS